VRVGNTRGQTTEPHLHTRRKDGLQHFTDLDVAKPRSPPSTHTVFNDGQYPKQYDFVTGRVASFKFAMRNGRTDRRKGDINGCIVLQKETVGEESV